MSGRNCGSGRSEHTLLCHNCGASIHTEKGEEAAEEVQIKRWEILFLFFSLAVIIMFLLTYKIRNSWPLSEDFDYVLAYGDGYYLVIKQMDDSSGNICSMIGVVNSDAEWIHPLRTDHIFLSRNYRDSGEEYIKENTSYIGEGMFLLIRKEMFGDTYTGLVYNARDDVGFCIRQYSSLKKVRKAGSISYAAEEKYSPAVTYRNGYWVILRGSGKRKEICIVDRFGHVRRTGKMARRLGQYSDGLFFADGCFYDIHLRPRLILEGYCIMNEPCFQNGKSSLVIKTERGEKYRIEMDRRGRLRGKPERV